MWICVIFVLILIILVLLLSLLVSELAIKSLMLYIKDNKLELTKEKIIPYIREAINSKIK